VSGIETKDHEVTQVSAIAVQTGPPPDLRFRRRIRFVPAMRELWRARELVRTLAERDFRVRYKQAALGAAWALLTPLALMLVFTVFFQRVAKIDTAGAPYALFAYLGLLPWTFFSTSVSQGGQTLVSNASLLNKVYCPREVFPIAGVMLAMVDMALAALVLLVLFAITGFMPHATTYWVLPLLLMQVAFTFGVTLVVSAVLVYMRDLRQALPIILQLGLFATPVAYGMNVVPGRFRSFYVALNPLAAVIDGNRRAILYGRAPDPSLVVPAVFTTCAVLVLGYFLFKRLETGFADVA
jgi:ABC-type polysaccharide/polyol phosphate export permease